MSNAYEYGRALFLLAEEDGSADRVRGDVETLRTAIGENPDFVKLLDTPALSKEEKLSVIDTALGTLDERAVNLTKILCEKHSAYMLRAALDGFCACHDEARGIERVEAVTAVAMTVGQLDRLKEKLEAKTGKTIIVNNTVDPTILGGMKVRYMGIQLDGSIKTRLDGFERALGDIVI